MSNPATRRPSTVSVIGRAEEVGGRIGSSLTAAWSVRVWVAACVVAETIGMTAAAAAARAADALQRDGAGRGAALLVVVCGGLVEGSALGVLQGRALRPFVGRSASRRWALVTVAIAGLGWAAAAAPSVLADRGSTSDQPPLLLVLAGAGALGVVMGAALGAAQAATLRGLVERPLRWVWISVIAWTPAMMLIFLGATLPSAQTSTATVVAVGAVTGVLAGATLGLLSGPLLPSVAGAGRRS